MCVDEVILIYHLIFYLMIKLNVMGKMKWISQMIQDGSFEDGFVPAYEEAQENNKPIFTYAGSTYSLPYGKIIIDYVNGFKNDIDSLKQLEK